MGLESILEVLSSGLAKGFYRKLKSREHQDDTLQAGQEHRAPRNNTLQTGEGQRNEPLQTG